MKRPYILVAGALFVAAAAVVAVRAMTRTVGGAPATPVPAATVRLAVARTVDLADPFDVGGEVRARTTATIVSRIVGQIREVRVMPGDRVRAGQPLVVLDSRELGAAQAQADASLTAARQAIGVASAEREAAEAGLALARATHRRIAELQAKESATPHELDEAVAGLRAAEARLAMAEARRVEADARVDAARAAADAARVTESYATLVAPFDGVVTEKLVEAGNTATPGLPLVRLDDTRGFRLELRLDESRVGLARAEGPVEVWLDADAAATPPLTGHVAEIARALDAGAHAFLVKIDLPAGLPVRSGMFGRARFRGALHRALVVPVSSLVRHGQLTSVFVAGSGGKARLRLVTAAEPDGERVEVRAGLQEGERVIVDPPAGLADGAPIVERQGR